MWWTGAAKDGGGFKAGVIGIGLVVQMVLGETVVGVLEEPGPLQIAVGQNGDGFGTVPLVPTEKLRLVATQIVGIHGQQETVTSGRIIVIVALDMTV